MKTKANDKKTIKYLDAIKKALTPQLINTTIILIILGVILCGIFAISIVSNLGNSNIQVDKIVIENDFATFKDLMGFKIMMMLLIVVAGFVPYCYISYIGYLAYVYVESGELGYYIVSNGVLGLCKGIIPLLLNLFVLATLTAIGAKICRNSTAKYKLSRASSTNLTTLKMKYYELTKNEEKLKTVKEKQQEMVDGLENKVEKINFRLLLVIFACLCMIQILSVLITQWSF